MSADGRFVGAWTLSSYEVSFVSGEVRKPFGDTPMGRILYQADGQMSAQLMQPGDLLFANSDPLQSTTAEAASAWANYIGYWGTFEVDEAAGAVIHHVEGSWFPNWIGQKQVRFFRFKEPHRLVLEASSPAWRVTLLWEKIV